MPLTEQHIDLIDQMIANNAKRADILTALVRIDAKHREVEDYLKENSTLQGMLNRMTRRAKAILKAGSEAERRLIVEEIVQIGKTSIRMLQDRASQ